MAEAKGDRIAIVGGARSPFAKSWSSLNDVDPVELSTQVARELIFRLDLKPEWIDHFVWGTVVAVPRSPNIAREVAMNLGMYKTPGFSVTRACATGFQSVTTAAEMIGSGHADVVIAGGVDVLSHAPVTYRKNVIDTLQKAQKAKGAALVKTLAGFNPLHLFPTPPALTERYTGLTMGQHAELMAQNFDISREDQDAFAIASHEKAAAAVDAGHIAQDIVPIRTAKGMVSEDNLIRRSMNPDKVAKLRPVFDKKNGTITAASSSPLTDGAAAVAVMKESKARELGLTPLAYVRSWDYPAIDPRENMLLGNVHSIPGALDRAGVTLDDIDLVDIHEAFAAQVLSNVRLLDDATFMSEEVGRSSVVGEVDPDKLNVWGGSIAFGHPFAATGGRMITMMLNALKERDGELALTSACAAGGLGVAMVLERAS
ncbi:MAG: acetyl-CoA C-acyltransferase [Deltaproteobacteria bacterium]|nr:acetyl-CoA C-acyltransferase [Deltaproteobacteria bacterium]